MKKFIFDKKLVITLLCLIISFLLIAFSIGVRNKRNTPTFIQVFGNEAAGAVDRIINLPVAGVRGAGGSVMSLMNTYQENQKLKKQVDKIASEEVENQTLSEENKQLKAELHLDHSLTSYTKINAYVISRAPSSWLNQVVISKGSMAGIRKNDAVLSKNGLVGRIVEVNKTNSKVELISTTNNASDRFAVQLKAANGKIINGLITSYDPNANRLIMGQIVSKHKIKSDTKVITSGMGGYIPKGLLVGDVTEVANNDAGLPTKIYIRPASDINDLNIVTVARRGN